MVVFLIIYGQFLLKQNYYKYLFITISYFYHVDSLHNSWSCIRSQRINFSLFLCQFGCFIFLIFNLKYYLFVCTCVLGCMGVGVQCVHVYMFVCDSACVLQYACRSQRTTPNVFSSTMHKLFWWLASFWSILPIPSHLRSTRNTDTKHLACTHVLRIHTQVIRPV